MGQRAPINSYYSMDTGFNCIYMGGFYVRSKVTSKILPHLALLHFTWEDFTPLAVARIEVV